VRKGADKLQKFLNSKQQGRLDDGFPPVKPKEKEKATVPGKGKGKTMSISKRWEPNERFVIKSNLSTVSIDLFFHHAGRRLRRERGK